MKYLNLGCGHRYHSAWTNVNFVSTGEDVIAHNLTQGIPFPDESFDVVYHSHVLEHFSQSMAGLFLHECHRVLRPNGILRVVVPDLEVIARIYLSLVEHASANNEASKDNYDWMVLELFDQTVRNHPGGEMLNYLYQESIPNLDFILNRVGTEAKTIIEAGRLSREQPHSPPKSRVQRLLTTLSQLLSDRTYRREKFLRWFLGDEYTALEIGRFRQSGEVHQWMYDRYSLKVLLEQSGFQQVQHHSAYSSQIENWEEFHLDVELDGTVYKPDSLFMEAVKLERLSAQAL